MSIADKIQRLENAKADIAIAITNKGGTVNEGDGFEEFSADIESIESEQKIVLAQNYALSEDKLLKATLSVEGDLRATIPNNVATIGANAFSGEKLLTEVVFGANVVSTDDGNPYSDNKGAFLNCGKLETVILNSSCSALGSYSFANCNALTTINSENLISIGSSAFASCSSLITFVFGNRLSIINSGAFAGTSLIDVDLSQTQLTLLDMNVFINCEALRTAIIPVTVSEIRTGAFSNCPSLTDIYYTGTQQQWGYISKGENAIPEGVIVHYEYVPE